MSGFWGQVLARGYYAVVGLVAIGITLSAGASAVDGASHGCQLVFSQAVMPEPHVDGPAAATCQQYVNVVGMSIGALASIVLAGTVWRFGRRDLASRVVVGLGAAVGLAAGAVPMWGIWWVSDYYDNATPDPLGLVIGAAPILVALAATAVTVAVHAGRSITGGHGKRDALHPV
jgi:hypothetical protein